MIKLKKKRSPDYLGFKHTYNHPAPFPPHLVASLTHVVCMPRIDTICFCSQMGALKWLYTGGGESRQPGKINGVWKKPLPHRNSYSFSGVRLLCHSART